jgi:hypothetical protein
LAAVTYDKDVTALLVIDPYNDSISEGGKIWGQVSARLLYSSRTLEDVIYRAELNGEEAVHTLTRAQPPGWTGYARRVDAARSPGRPRTGRGRSCAVRRASWSRSRPA